jgi:hypothetical protein
VHSGQHRPTFFATIPLMAYPVLRIDPRLPLVWQTPSTLQIGVDPPRVVVEDLSEGALILLEALVTGVTQPGAELLAREAGVCTLESNRVLHALQPVFITKTELPLPTFALLGQSAQRGVMTTHLRALGHSVALTHNQKPRATETVLVGNYVLDPALYQQCISIDLAHTPVVFQDQSVVVGPRVTPGSGPCLHCVWENAVARAPHHGAVMSQLWRRSAPADTAEMALLATTQVLELVRKPQEGLVLRIDALNRVVSEHFETPSSECRCRSLSLA